MTFAKIEEALSKIESIDRDGYKLNSVLAVSKDLKFNESEGPLAGVPVLIKDNIEAIGLPETVTTRENGFKAVKYEKLNALLIEGFKAQQREIDELKALVSTLLNK